MASGTERNELEQIGELLQRHGVEFIVIGGQAEVLHGGSRVTYDVDLCYRRTKMNMDRLAEALKELQPTLRGAPRDLPFRLDGQTFQMGCNFTFDTALVALDLLGYVEPLGEFDEVRKNAVVYRSAGVELWTISVDDLLKVKRHINRAKDQESIAQLLAIKRVREEGNGGRSA